MTENELALRQENENVQGWKKKTVLFLSGQTLSLFGSSLRKVVPYRAHSRRSPSRSWGFGHMGSI